MEINKMVDGLIRRREYEENMLIIYSALPGYNSAFMKKPITFEQLTQHRQSSQSLPEIDHETCEHWRKILEEN